MLQATMPTGESMAIPETIEEDKTYFTVNQLDEARSFYEEQGYVVIRNLISSERCERVRRVFDANTRTTKQPILRQKNMRYERNDLNGDGFLANPIFNVQDLGNSSIREFRDAVLDILTDPNTATASAHLMGVERVKLIQSMFFEAPAGTWAHQDSYYQDSANGLGRCVAGWFALEDINAGAGRFYVCPGSHRSMEPIRNAGPNNFATGHAHYKDAIVEAMRVNALRWSAPYLAAGDVLFWNSLTVHGSLGASRPGVSRTSLTAHYLPESDPMLQFHTRIRPQRTMRYNEMLIGLLHDQRQLHNKMVREIAFHFPTPYMRARQLALQALLARNAVRKLLRRGRPQAPAI